ncbi:transglycosylase domain-containing protein [Rhodohalobacter sp. SW132]|uniref:transglycosylase domain-containing protein n=1 Tax=Rhodohalobacter sp. SW132 TaxID=2293433 RepID=UPI0013141FCD|nr:transglycosylase domain-containing protein [Rhodohalobacter sp. SW132]
MNRKNRRPNRWLKITVSLAAILIAGFLLFISLIWSGFFGPIPNTEELSSIQHQQATRILSADGEQIGTYHLQNRTTVSLDEIDSTMVDALLAIEDVRFHRHNGIDYRALGRVLVRTILLRQNSGGGSTLTQQLVKNLYPRQTNGGLSIIAEKFREMMIARNIESIYSKDEILELYLNTVSFGEDTFGIEMASYRFFSKPPSDLTLPESATLAGLLRATTFYNPHRHPERATLRRNIVIRQMERYGFIPSEEAEIAIADSLDLKYDRRELSDGPAPYFREHLRPMLSSLIHTEPALDGKQYNLYTDGLTIHTTLQSEIQFAAEKAVSAQMKHLQQILDKEIQARPIFGEEDPDVLRAWRQSDRYVHLKNRGYSDDELRVYLHTPATRVLFTWDGYEETEITPYNELRYYLSFMNAGFVAMQPGTGHVLAWVGGIEHKHFQFDQVTASRQAGSAFKPILYAAAIENGRTPCDYQRNFLATYATHDDWTPKNVRDEYGGRYSLQAALSHSINTVAVQLAVETGVPAIQKTAADLGIRSAMPDAPSLALGTAEVSLLELTSAYTSFLNSGKPASPVMVTHITNNQGDLIYDFRQKDEADLVSVSNHSHLTTVKDGIGGITPETAAAIAMMLQRAVDEGTGTALKNQFGIQQVIGGKTGTTQNFADGWFVGFTPEFVFGTRIGGYNNRVRFREFPAYASQTALPLAGRFLQNLPDRVELAGDFQPVQFSAVDLPYSMVCEDYKNDRLRDRVSDFFRGRSSDEPRVIGDEEDKDRNIFRRLGRQLGISGN